MIQIKRLLRSGINLKSNNSGTPDNGNGGSGEGGNEGGGEAPDPAA